MNLQMNLYYHFFEKKNQLISTSCLFYGKTHFPYNERRNESWLLFRKRKKPVYINLPVLKEGNWFFEVLRIQRKKKTNESEWIKFKSCLCIPVRRSKALLSKWNWLKQLLRLSSTTWSPMSIKNYHNWCFVKWFNSRPRKCQ